MTSTCNGSTAPSLVCAVSMAPAARSATAKTCPKLIGTWVWLVEDVLSIATSVIVEWAFATSVCAAKPRMENRSRQATIR